MTVLVHANLFREDLEGNLAPGKVGEIVVAMDPEILAVQWFRYNFIA